MSDCGLSVSFQPSGSTVLVLDGLTDVGFALTSLGMFTDSLFWLHIPVLTYLIIYLFLLGLFVQCTSLCLLCN